jgi:hypothetical protein
LVSAVGTEEDELTRRKTLKAMLSQLHAKDDDEGGSARRNQAAVEESMESYGEYFPEDAYDSGNDIMTTASEAVGEKHMCKHTREPGDQRCAWGPSDMWWQEAQTQEEADRRGGRSQRTGLSACGRCAVLPSDAKCVAAGGRAGRQENKVVSFFSGQIL